MIVLTKHIALLILISFFEIRSSCAQDYTFQLALKQTSSTAKDLKLKETVALIESDTIRHYIYKNDGSLYYEMELDRFRKIKSIVIFEEEYTRKQKVWVDHSISYDTVVFNDGTKLIYNYNPAADRPLSFKVTEQQNLLFPQLKKLEPFLKRYNAFDYQFSEISEYGDTVQVNVKSIDVGYLNNTLSVRKKYGMCLDSLFYDEFYTFDTSRIHTYEKKVRRYIVQKPEFEVNTSFENGKPKTIKQEDFRQNRRTLYTFNADSFPQVEYTFFDTCNIDIPREKLFFHDAKYVKRINYENYFAQYSTKCVCWNAVHYDSEGKKIKKEKFLRDNYYVYNDSLWFDINRPFKNPRALYSSRNEYTCGGGGNRYGESYYLPKGMITVEDYYSANSKKLFDSVAFTNFKQTIESNIRYPAMRLDAEIQWTDSLLITANKSLTKIYSVESTPSYGKNDNSVLFLMKRFESLNPLQNFTSVMITLQDGSQHIKLPINDDSRVTFNLNMVYRIKSR